MTSTARWWFPMIGSLLGPGWQAAAEILRDGEWHEVSRLVEVMGSVSDAQPKSLSSMLREASHAGVLEFNSKGSEATVRITLVAPFLLPELRDETFPVHIVSAVGIEDGDDGLWSQIAPLWDEAARELRAKQPAAPRPKVVPLRKPTKATAPVGVEPEGAEHPNGEACDKCHAVLTYKIVTRTRDGQKFRLWACPNSRRRGDGHRSEFINDDSRRPGIAR